MMLRIPPWLYAINRWRWGAALLTRWANVNESAFERAEIEGERCHF